MRYVVTEIEGFRTAREGAHNDLPGLTTHVLDVAFNHRVVFTARTEELASRSVSHEQARSTVRERAATRCDLLNRLDEIAREAQGAVSA